jgi:hypothetical protein
MINDFKNKTESVNDVIKQKKTNLSLFSVTKRSPGFSYFDLWGESVPRLPRNKEGSVLHFVNWMIRGN